MPEESWETHDCKLMSCAPDEATARRRLMRAEKGIDDVNTEPENEGRRPKHPPKRFMHEQDNRSTTRKRRRTSIKDASDSEAEGSSETEVAFDVPPFPAEKDLRHPIVGGQSSSARAASFSQLQDCAGNSPQSPARDAMSESCAGSAVFSPAPGSCSPLHLRPASTRTNTVRNSSVEPMSNSPRQPGFAMGPTRTQQHSNSGFERTVLRELTAIRHEVGQLQRAVAFVTSRRGVNISLPVELPCASLEDVQELSEFVEIEANRENLERQLANVGGSNVQEVVRRIIRRLLTPATASRYSFRGKRGKLAFQATPLWLVVRGASMLSIKTTEKDIESATKNQLRHAKDPERSHSGQGNTGSA